MSDLYSRQVRAAYQAIVHTRNVRRTFDNGPVYEAAMHAGTVDEFLRSRDDGSFDAAIAQAFETYAELRAS